MIPTAKDYCEKRHNESPNTISWIDFNVMVMNEYTKLHVEAALKAASDSRCINMYNNQTWFAQSIEAGSKFLDRVNITVNKEAIINSYPLINIK